MNEERLNTIEEIMDQLDAGTLGKRLAKALEDTALGVVATGDRKKAGKVTLEFDIKQIGESNQVMIDHTISFKKPTHRGSVAEVHTTSTTLFVGTRGKLTILNNETREMFQRQTEES
jgi:hypothetical protein